jgi:hypothetical protein
MADLQGSCKPLRSPAGNGHRGLAVFSEHLTGLDFYLNASMIDASSATHIRKVLQDALKAIEKAVPQYS